MATNDMPFWAKQLHEGRTEDREIARVRHTEAMELIRNVNSNVVHVDKRLIAVEVKHPALVDRVVLLEAKPNNHPINKIETGSKTERYRAWLVFAGVAFTSIMGLIGVLIVAFT